MKPEDKKSTSIDEAAPGASLANPQVAAGVSDDPSRTPEEGYYLVWVAGTSDGETILYCDGKSLFAHGTAEKICPGLLIFMHEKPLNLVTMDIKEAGRIVYPHEIGLDCPGEDCSYHRMINERTQTKPS
ncbi:hypothetical protein ACYPKM_00575 [Pseudomonas aeruginosa]